MALYMINIIALHGMMYLLSVTASQLARVKSTEKWKSEMASRGVDAKTIWTEDTFMSLVFDLI